MSWLKRLWGRPINPFSPESSHRVALVALFAWVGLGADGLSSICYGPQMAFYALRGHLYLAGFLALMTAVTVFVIALSYNQVIRLFPSGGGGYKVASTLLGPLAGLVSGAALVIDYALTIAISVASGAAALFSILPADQQMWRLPFALVALLILLILNLRGAKESIRILLPIFFGFVVTHMTMVVLGVVWHRHGLLPVLSHTLQDSQHMVNHLGLAAVLVIFMRAYVLGAGTYTGLEAVSNNVQLLASPREKTGRLTMMYMAVSLSIMAAGFILLYLLWPQPLSQQQTLNVLTFRDILHGVPGAHFYLQMLIFFEVGILLIAANTGFLGGPAVLANLSLDEWMPKRFARLSSRLVTQNGIVFFAVLGAIFLLLSGGSIALLVILYSANVFVTFCLSLLGLVKYWWQARASEAHWLRHGLLALFGLLISVAILSMTLVTQFYHGGWLAFVLTMILVGVCWMIRRHYQAVRALKQALDASINIPVPVYDREELPAIDPQAPTAVFFVKERGATLHTLLWVQRLFPGVFKNIIWITHVSLDVGTYGANQMKGQLQQQTNQMLDQLTDYALSQGFAVERICQYGTDPLAGLVKEATKINEYYPQAVYFTAKYIYPTDNMWVRLMHSDLSASLQRHLQAVGAKVLSIPLQLKI